MHSFELSLDGKAITILVADTAESRHQGLSGADHEDTGMLFVFPSVGHHQMWMKDTKHPLDIYFLNSEMEVVEHLAGKPEDEKMLGSHSDVAFVLELPVDTFSIEVGDKLGGVEPMLLIAEDVPAAAALLDEEGNEQMNIFGKERIFSRDATRTMVHLAKHAQHDQDLIALGKFIADEIHAQETRGPEYVDEDKTRYAYNEQGGETDELRILKEQAGNLGFYLIPKKYIDL